VSSSRVKSRETQQRGKLSQMNVEGKTHRPAEDHYPTRRRTRDIDAMKCGIHRHIITILHSVGEVCRLPVDHDDIDFGWGTRSTR
jgi:hypothetical protein